MIANSGILEALPHVDKEVQIADLRRQPRGGDCLRCRAASRSRPGGVAVAATGDGCEVCGGGGVDVGVYGVGTEKNSLLALLGTLERLMEIVQSPPDVPDALYGPTKAAVHWFAKRINDGEERDASFVLHPG